MAPPASKGTQKKSANYQQKPYQAPEKNLSSDPNDILAKLNNKSNISAYNPTALHAKEKQRQHNQPKPHSQQQSQRQQYSPTTTRRQPINTSEAFNPITKDSVVIDQHFKSSIKCKAFTNQPKLDGDYEITVTGHEIINPNPFVPNHVLYSITTNPVGVEVKRRLKDFQTLRNLLKKIFPNLQVPLLERYGRRLSETDPITIRKQKLFLQSFLNSLMLNKNIRCKIIDEFLLC